MYDMKPYLAEIGRVIAEGPYTDSWASLEGYRVPEWYRQAKFGIFIHWGVYSVPAFGSEWYSRNMYIQGTPEYEHHIKTYGPHTQFGYKDFIPLFKGERFDPAEWAALFKRAGARYVVPVAEHHDGFQMYKSEISRWNAAEMGPRRDVLGELKRECEARGLAVGASSHRVEHWFFMGRGREFDSDIREPLARGDLYWPSVTPEPNHYDLFSEPVPTEEFMQDWLVRTCELVDRFHPRVLYFDWWIQHSAVRPWLRKLAAYYYNRCAQWGQEPVINYKHDSFGFGCAVPDVERGQFALAKPWYWQTDTAIGLDSWGHTATNRFKSGVEVLQNLLDVVSKNGNLLLNVGPRADGSITEEERKVLLEVGDWLRVNGEAVYGSEVWRVSGEGDTEVPEGPFCDGEAPAFTSSDFRFTAAGGNLYAAAMRGAADGRYLIRSLARISSEHMGRFGGIIRDVKVLGAPDAPVWSHGPEGLEVRTAPGGDAPVVIRIELE